MPPQRPGDPEVDEKPKLMRIMDGERAGGPSQDAPEAGGPDDPVNPGEKESSGGPPEDPVNGNSSSRKQPPRNANRPQRSVSDPESEVTGDAGRPNRSGRSTPTSDTPPRSVTDPGAEVTGVPRRPQRSQPRGGATDPGGEVTGDVDRSTPKPGSTRTGTGNNQTAGTDPFREVDENVARGNPQLGQQQNLSGVRGRAATDPGEEVMGDVQRRPPNLPEDRSPTRGQVAGARVSATRKAAREEFPEAQDVQISSGDVSGAFTATITTAGGETESRVIPFTEQAARDVLSNRAMAAGLSGEDFRIRERDGGFEVSLTEGPDPAKQFSVREARLNRNTGAKFDSGVDPDTSEQFGDTPIFQVGEGRGFTGGMGRGRSSPNTRVEDVLGSAADRFSRRAAGVAEVVGQAAPESLHLADDVAIPGQPGRRENIEGDDVSEQFFTGTVRGGLELGNVPRILAAGKEAGEFVAAGTVAATPERVRSFSGGTQRETFGEGRGSEFGSLAVEEAGQRAGAALRAGSENPTRTIGMLVGSVAGSAGAIGAASRISPGAGRAVSTAIQPGEEAAIFAARRGLIPASTATKVPGVSKGMVHRDRGQLDLTFGGRLETAREVITGDDLDVNRGEIRQDPPSRREMQKRRRDPFEDFPRERPRETITPRRERGAPTERARRRVEERMSMPASARRRLSALDRGELEVAETDLRETLDVPRPETSRANRVLGRALERTRLAETPTVATAAVTPPAIQERGEIAAVTEVGQQTVSEAALISEVPGRIEPEVRPGMETQLRPEFAGREMLRTESATDTGLESVSAEILQPEEDTRPMLETTFETVDEPRREPGVEPPPVEFGPEARRSGRLRDEAGIGTGDRRTSPFDRRFVTSFAGLISGVGEAGEGAARGMMSESFLDETPSGGADRSVAGMLSGVSATSAFGSTGGEDAGGAFDGDGVLDDIGGGI